MAAQCFSAIHLCRIRATRLDALGNPAAGPNNVYVSDKPLQLGVTPVVEAGQDLTDTGGCDCITAIYRGYDKLKRFDLELDLATLEPGLTEMLLGATAILSAADPIGVWWPTDQFDCGATQANICFEGWQDSWDVDHQAASPLQYVHWIWPSTYWQIAPFTLGNEFNHPKINGFSRGNDNWGLGIFGDLPEAAEPLGGYFYTDERPDAQCGYTSQSVS